MKRSEFLRLGLLGATGAFVFRPSWAMGAIDYSFQGTPAGVRPYLHAPKPDSMRVSWWTNADAQTHVDFGTSAGSLGETVAGTRTVMGTNYHYHAARLTGLQPDTYYYYRVRTENVTSEVFRFRTPKPIGTSTGKYRVLVMGDNQLLNPTERRFERFVERAKKKVEDLYGVPIEECIDLVLMPGDQVDVGTLEHYRHLHFGYNGWISPNVPIMTTIGNHETYSDPGLANYKTIFTYDDLNCLGVNSPDPEVYYAYQLANIAFVHMSSEHTGGTQLGWVQNLVNAANSSSTVDWMISLCHRPYNAEQYIGDISGWLRTTAMPVLAQTDKHVLNIGAHHHIYARGQTRDWPIYHIISGGTAWDQYWGQSNEADYDDVQKTIAHWVWQLIEFDLDERTMDVRCFAEGNVRLPQSTRWSYNSRLVDQFHRKHGLAAPSTPSLTNSITGPVTLPLELVSSAYVASSGEALNSTWFQVSADAGFSSPVIDRIRGVENFYGDTGSPNFEPVDTHDGLDVLRYGIVANGLANGNYWARVRHRDENATWSAWSAALPFVVGGSGLVGTPGISMGARVYAPNENFTIAFENGPGNAKDWVGIYQKGQAPGPVASSEWFYVNGSKTSGAAGIRSGVLPFTKNIANGEWYAAFFSNDSYNELAPRVEFFVGPKPVLAVTQAAHEVGEDVTLQFSGAPAGLNDWIGIYRQGRTPSTSSPSQSWRYLNGTNAAPGAGIAAGTIVFANLPKGYYYADYFVNDGYFGIAERVVFSVGSEITLVDMESTVVEPGEDFTVTFSDGPGIAKDWMGLFRKGDVPGPDPLTAYLYVDGRTEGSVTFELPDLPPGDYFVALFTDDSYTEVSNRFFFSVPGNEELKLEESRVDESEVMLAWQSRAGVEYDIEASVDLDEWATVLTMDGTGGRMEAVVPIDSADEPQRFFRVTVR
jgi:hypothetical protein